MRAGEIGIITLNFPHNPVASKIRRNKQEVLCTVQSHVTLTLKIKATNSF